MRLAKRNAKRRYLKRSAPSTSSMRITMRKRREPYVRTSMYSRRCVIHIWRLVLTYCITQGRRGRISCWSFIFTHPRYYLGAYLHLHRSSKLTEQNTSSDWPRYHRSVPFQRSGVEIKARGRCRPRCSWILDDTVFWWFFFMTIYHDGDNLHAEYRVRIHVSDVRLHQIVLLKYIAFLPTT